MDMFNSPYKIICQIIGIVAMSLVFISYQQKKQNTLIRLQLFSSALFAVHFFMLGAVMGGVLNIVSAFRAFIYSNKEKFKGEHIGWLLLFSGISIAAYIVNFTVLKTEPTLKNFIIEVFPVIAMISLSMGFRTKDAKASRNYSLICSPSWLIYNIAKLSIGGIMSDSFAVISIIIGKIRLDLKHKQEVSK